MTLKPLPAYSFHSEHYNIMGFLECAFYYEIELFKKIVKYLLDDWCILGDNPISNRCVTRMCVLFPYISNIADCFSR